MTARCTRRLGRVGCAVVLGAAFIAGSAPLAGAALLPSATVSTGSFCDTSFCYTKLSTSWTVTTSGSPLSLSASLAVPTQPSS
jgi:hypothetical protein